MTGNKAACMVKLRCHNHVWVPSAGTKQVQEAVKGGAGGGRYIPINAVQVIFAVEAFMQQPVS